VGMVARESCPDASHCSTSFEILVSDDDARTWNPG